MQFQLKKEWVIPTSIGIASFAGGVALGYILGQRKKLLRLEVRIEEVEQFVETKDVEDHFRIEAQTTRFDSMMEQAAVTTQHFRDLAREHFEPEEAQKFKAFQEVLPFLDHPSNLHFQDDPEGENPKMNVVNIIRQQDMDWDYDEEERKREANPNKPYIIHRDEFDNREAEGFGRSQLMYYAGDDVLCDEGDVPVYEPKKIVGELIFGKGSGDPSIVFVRNPVLEMEYEILLDPGHFIVEVLGETLEADLKQKDLKHSSVLKFRQE